MNDFDLANPDKVPFGEMPQWAQWALEGALMKGAVVEHFYEESGRWIKKRPRSSMLLHIAYRVRPETVRKTTDLQIGLIRLGPSSLKFAPNDSFEAVAATKGTATLTTEDGKPVEMTWKADQ